MKKQSFRRHSGGLLVANPQTFGIVVLCLVLVVAFLRVAFPDAFFTAAAPILRVGTAASEVFHAVSAPGRDMATLEGERARLTLANEALANENRVLAARIDALARLLGSRTEALEGVRASVLARPPLSAYDTLVLDQGSADGVVKKALVTGDGGIPLGTIETVSQGFSHMSLFSSAGRSTSALIGAAHAALTLIGAGAGSFEATVPQTASVLVGDEVFLAAGGLPVGYVARIDTDPSSPTKMLRILPYANPFTISLVMISRAALP